MRVEKVLLNFSLILILVYFYKITRHGLHILQLENYYVDRYAVWMKRYIKKVVDIKRIVLLLVPIVCFAINDPKAIIIGFILEILALMALIVTTKKQKEKKAFVVTARIKRVYLTYLILFVILFVTANILDYRIVLSIVIFVLCLHMFLFIL